MTRFVVRHFRPHSALESIPSIPHGSPVTKAFLLGAGLGTRLRPLTNRLPKPLIPVMHRPLVTYALDHSLDAGIREFAINTHHLPEEWVRFFANSSAYDRPAPPTPLDSLRPPPPAGPVYRDAPVTLFHEPVLLETGGGLKNIESWIGDEPVLVYNADVLTNLSLDRLIASHLAFGTTVTLGLRSTGPNPHVAIDGNRVTDIRGLLGIAEGTHQFTGIYCINPDFPELIPARRKISVIPAFLELARRGSLGACLLDDRSWLDLGTRDNYLAAHFEPAAAPLHRHPMVHPEARIAPSATVESSAVGPRAVVGPHAVLRHSIVWPECEIAPEARLTNCVVCSSSPVSGAHKDTDL